MRFVILLAALLMPVSALSQQTPIAPATDQPVSNADERVAGNDQPLEQTIEPSSSAGDPRQEAHDEQVLTIAGSDLTQQTRMADATEKLANDSARAMQINTVTLFLIFLGTLASGVAAFAAKRSADAAMESAKKDRAWLLVKTDKARIADASFVERDHIALILRVKNSGAAPAKDMKIGTGYYVASEFDANHKIDFVNDRNRGMVMGGNGEEMSLPVYIRSVDIDRARPGPDQQLIFFKIHLSYETITQKGAKVTSGWYGLQIVQDDPDAYLLGKEEKLELAITSIAGTFEFT